MKNPFELSFGIKPSNYIERIGQTNEIINDFLTDESNKVYMITGARGSGKTVMLSNIINHFENEKDWISLELIPSVDMLDQFASKLYDTSLLRKLLNGKTFGFSFNGISFSIKGEKPVTNVMSLLEILLDNILKNNKKVLLCVDEISCNEFTRTFVQAFQVLLRKGYPIHLLMTGLYQNIYELQNDKTLTFLYRAPRILLDPLNISSISNSYKNLLELSEKESLKIAKLTKGYAFAYQVLGYLMYKNNKKEIDQMILNELDQYLQEYVYEKTWSELSNNDQLLLLSFTSEEEITADLLKKSNFDKNTFSVYRDRLIKRGIIRSTGYGKLAISLPRFLNYLLLYK